MTNNKPIFPLTFLGVELREEKLDYCVSIANGSNDLMRVKLRDIGTSGDYSVSIDLRLPIKTLNILVASRSIQECEEKARKILEETITSLRSILDIEAPLIAPKNKALRSRLEAYAEASRREAVASLERSGAKLSPGK